MKHNKGDSQQEVLSYQGRNWNSVGKSPTHV
ncbi:hypothetical protein BOSE46_140154 [Bosea sp. 46]|nr:hypothetical protein BOSE46_140154 [Bosea sp. 46]VXB95627.1 hypothetical protein BOSE29B_150148 [Bosea sp. 29B]VXC40967.1 hypothetical protein BOSE125_200121 [Bosea sp. 125]